MAKRKHRAFQITTLHAAVFFAVLTFLMFAKLLLGAAYPWDDLINFEIPFRVFEASCLRHGIFPLWNPYSFCGTPFPPGLHAALYPTNLLMSFLIGEGSLGSRWIEFFVIAHYWLAAFAMFFLCRNELKKAAGRRCLPELSMVFPDL